MGLIEEINNVFCEVFDDEDLKITEQMTADDIEDWDSITHINLVCAIEEKFSCNFTTREIAKLDNVGDLIGLVKGKTGLS